jgi:TetR/AcrR family transcriptional repressor of nem operon
MARPIAYDPDEALEKATDLFWSRGYQSVSVDDLVRTTGLNRHSLYARYGNKYGLFKAALGRYGSHAVGIIKDILTGPGAPSERLERLMHLRDPDRADIFWRRMMERGCLGLRAASELRASHPELADGTRAFEQSLVAMLAVVIAEGQSSGEFRTDRTAIELAEVFTGGFMAPLVLSPSAARNTAYLAMLR